MAKTLIVEKASKHKLEPVIGRDEEIQRVVNILSRSTKNNNPLLVGEYGVGKTAIVEGVAQRIAKGDVPSNLINVCLIDLDLGAYALTNGARNRREMEKRLEAIMNEAQKAANGKVIVFIDEIHFTQDALHLWKHAVSRGQLKCIGTTIPGEYKKYVEKDASIEGMFQQVHVAELSVSDTIRLLRAQKKKYEAHYGVRIQDKALVAAAQLSAQFIQNGRCMPEKAIIMVGYACSSAAAPLKQWPLELEDLEMRSNELGSQVINLQKANDKASKARLAEVKRELQELKDKLEPHKRERERQRLRNDALRKLIDEEKRVRFEIKQAEERSDSLGVVDPNYYSLTAQLEYIIEKQMLMTDPVGPEHIAQVVSRKTGIPVSRLAHTDHKDRLVGHSGNPKP